jgi:hypothetical protein
MGSSSGGCPFSLRNALKCQRNKTTRCVIIPPVKHFVLILTVLVVAACGGSVEDPITSPFLIKLDPKDHGKMDAIKNSPLGDRFKKQLELLATKNHDIEWFPTSLGTVTAHDTVQIIYFDYSAYVVGFCSGAFVSDNFVASAAHCNESVYALQKEGAKCEENVLFAYKPSETAAMEYYRCDRVELNQLDRTRYTPGDQGENPSTKAQERSRLVDHTLYRLANAAGKPPLRVTFTQSESWYQKTGGLVPSDAVVGLVVDPPSGSGDFASKYDIFAGKIVDADSTAEAKSLRLTDGVFLEATINSSEAGNSGGPIYRLDALLNRGDAVADNRAYVAPLSGMFPSSGHILFPYASTFLPKLFSTTR